MTRQVILHELGWAILFGAIPGVVLALLGPLGSFAAPVAYRFLFWVPTMIAGSVAGLLFGRLLESAPDLQTRPMVRAVTLGLLVTAFMTVVVHATGTLVFGPGAIPMTSTFVFYVGLITLMMTVLSTLMLERQKRVEAASPLPVDTAPIPASLPDRLSPKLKGAPVLALEAEDHYVRVHTPAGSELILIRLADAAREMGNTPGARTHRSWWVARAAVKTVNRSSGKTTLLLLNDIEVPVSRGFIAELREAGWFNG
jgi:LytTr DNA-binding domain